MSTSHDQPTPGSAPGKRVRYVGGSADGVVITETPPAFHEHPQRELHGSDIDAPHELYRNVGEQGQGDQRAVVFEFAGAATERRLDDDMNPLAGTPQS